ncbi:MAG: exopolysaccharide biosynthesis polyprenyl glycosylphosphotransferase [Bulleidia sp.]|nr:exopolysaccharide biosynthesis polyprenyl glycosylphosphotransferase [Bulleidia sp.]
MKKRRELALLLICSDLLVLYILHSLFGLGSYINFARYSAIYLLICIIFRNYRCSVNLIWDEFKNLILSHTTFFFVTQVMNPLKKWETSFFWKNLGAAFFMLILAMVIDREYRSIIFYKKFQRKVLIIGSGDTAYHLTEIFRQNRFTMAEVSAVVNCNRSETFPGFRQKECEFKETVIPYDEMKSYLQGNYIDEALIAVPDADKAMSMRIYGDVCNYVETIKIAPRVNGLISYGASVEDFDGSIMVSSALGNIRFNTFGSVVKRVIDILAGLVGIIVLIPLSIYVKIGNLRCGDKGPLFYTQDRVGRGGKTFKLIKYRSMVIGAEEKLQKLMEEDPAIREEYETNKKLVNDPRVTAFGKKIRESSIDEMPQLINVLLGQMSLVGPRPYLPNEMKETGETYHAIVGCKPGITGMWQTHGRSEASWSNRLFFDEYYYRNWSIWLDLTILVKTFRTITSKEGAY